ncbi:hypothetical protein DVA86_25100 [Streptomyces armeniacus]|uniref:Uncharacterized protein n=1 Tax=Streptomyces armeniacus TaxID=83291 RepID=A0A345XUX2_9ACTN|nr:hypothetical protein [Streptomyces armeniacus]AXK35438.1 hypothetical protein DVA86_25100 [Streptomyces armeniacus]
MTVHDVAAVLPGIPVLRDLCRSMAMADAVLNPDDEPYYSFNAGWSETEELASMRTGSGDEFDIVFSSAGAYIRGFDHESPLSPYHRDDVPAPWPGVVDTVPAVFRGLVSEPAFTDEDGTPVVTVCMWRQEGDDRWQAGQIDFPGGHPDPDGSDWLFGLLADPTPEAFQAFAEDYYETAVDIEAVRHVYGLRPLDHSAVAGLNPDASYDDLVAAAEAIGYPLA